MSRLFFILTVVLFTAMHSLAVSNDNAGWQKGNNFYQQKQYDSAAYYFEQIAAGKPQNAEVYYNLGNTYYRLNKINYAVLNYERALRINPNYNEARDNLILAQGRISSHIPATGDIFFINWWQTITDAGKATGWAVAALAVFAIIFALLLLRLFKRNLVQNIPSQLTGGWVCVCACLLVPAFFSAKNSVQDTGAVVMVNDAPLMNSEIKGAPLALVPEGTVVKIKSEKGAWDEVRLPDGRTGWLQQSLVEKI